MITIKRGASVRRSLALALAAAGLAVAGCGSSDSNTDSAASGSSKPASTASGKGVEGKKICYSSPVNIDVMNEMFSNITKAAGADGVHVQVVDGAGNPAKQLQDATQFVESGQCDAIGVVTSLTSDTASAWSQLATRAAAKKVVFTNFSADWITDAALNVSNPHCPGGEAVANVAAEWYKSHGGSGDVGVLTAPQSAGLIQRSKCFKEAFTKLVGKPVKFYEAADNKGGVQDSAAATASLLQAHPNINVMFGWGADTSVGIVQAVKEAGHKDPGKFFVGAMDLYAPSLADIATGKSVLQAGTVFDYDYAGTSWNWAIENALAGKQVPPTAVALPIVVTPKNAAQVLSADKQLASSGGDQDFFGKAIVYCDSAVKTGDPFPPASACAPNPAFYKAL